MKKLIFFIGTIALAQTAGTITTSSTKNVKAVAGTITCTFTNQTPAVPAGVSIDCSSTVPSTPKINGTVVVGGNGIVMAIVVAPDNITFILKPDPNGVAWQVSANATNGAGVF